MPNIGVVLAGCASKGAYEAGCLRAIEDYFGIENIKCVSSASIGALVAQMHCVRQCDEFLTAWKSLDTRKIGRFIITYPNNKDVQSMIARLLDSGSEMAYEHFVSIWNFTKRKVEYVPFHELSNEQLVQYLRGAMSIPLFSKGVNINGDKVLDGAFLDNIPVYPLVGKELDYVFCVYFDNYRYTFEDEAFDRKVVKLYDFPNKEMLEVFTFRTESFDTMMQYGYDYTTRVIREVFTSEEPEEVYQSIANREKNLVATYKPRFTADLVLNSINVMTKRYSKSMSNRVKEKAASK